MRQSINQHIISRTHLSICYGLYIERTKQFKYSEVIKLLIFCGLKSPEIDGTCSVGWMYGCMKDTNNSKVYNAIFGDTI